MENHPPSPAQSATTNPPTESSFSFTPIKALSALPRLWDRKPSTPVRAGDKSRKLWKRIRFPFGGMKTEPEGQSTGIGAAKNPTSDYQRGVKRRCVDPSDAEQETEMEQRGRSFLETKWEMQASRKKRKMPEFNFNIHNDNPQSVFGFTGNQSATNDVAMNDSPQPLSDIWQSAKTPVYNDAQADLTASDSKDAEDLQSTSPDQVVPPVIAQAGETVGEPAQDLTQEQEVKLVRSALRSSLDGEDAELLNDFLSRAKAKRAAKASHPEDAEPTEVSSSTEESPEVERSTPRSRRVLEDLNTNSPSPVKVQLSPSKHDVKLVPVDAEEQEQIIHKEIMEEPAPASPACRRSSRTKGPSAPSVRNTIALRRAKGTEFIFLQRTDSQQLALATKRNTRLNKGKSVTPMVALEALAQELSEESAQAGTDEHESPPREASSTKRKQVSWNEERMAEYEEYKEVIDEFEDEGDQCKDDVGATPRRAESKRSTKKAAPAQRSSRRQTEKAEQGGQSGATDGGLTAPTAPASATPRSRRVRRLGDLGKMGSGTPVKTGSSTSKPSAAEVTVAVPAPSTPTKGRRKISPKSPSSSKLPAPASKAAKQSTDQSFVSGIPTRSTKSTDDSSRSHLQMSAGCTPAAKRVRSRS
ncbi:hypothetical protein N7452_003921 [Penicillium brevicompactum]|uniref:Uncharacterized protein n=1 Tax=Penicillium brevicompactum TaxID=5074 RepID=A0A9W9QUK9_PENBR|nr:hypothetical protein N7452_003921 [Penicillium brevicompactum]